VAVADYLRQEAEPGDLLVTRRLPRFWAVARYLAGPAWGSPVAVQPLPIWKLRTSWTHIHRSGNEPGAFVSPNQLAMLSYMELPGNLELDVGMYYTGRITVAERPPVLEIPGYWRVDLRLGWSPLPGLDLELIGQNLTDRRHAEYAHLNVRTAAPLLELGTRYNELPRAGYARVTWRF